MKRQSPPVFGAMLAAVAASGWSGPARAEPGQRAVFQQTVQTDSVPGASAARVRELQEPREPFADDARTDGAIVVTDPPAARGALRAALMRLGFDSLDVDHDGSVTEGEAAEIPELTESLFGSIDADADGRLDQFEFDDFVEREQDDY